MDTLSNVSSSCAISAGTSAAANNNNISSSTRIEEDGSAVKSGTVTAVFTSVRSQVGSLNLAANAICSNDHKVYVIKNPAKF